MLYVITDTHLGHRAMCHSCGRPENFSEQICHNWQNMVNPADTVIHLGDIAWDEQWLHRLMRLPGRKILVRGNHELSEHRLQQGGGAAGTGGTR